VTDAAQRWREPSRRLPLRWGTYEGRYLAGLLFIIGGLVVLDGSNTYVVPFLLIGTVAHTTGWLIMPSRGSRRIWVVGPSLAIVWILLTGPQSLFFMAVPFTGWLFVRERPLRSYVTVLLVVGAGILIANNFHHSQDEAAAFGIESAVVVASAWLARALATTRRPRAVRTPA
jgi:hypothetical protein